MSSRSPVEARLRKRLSPQARREVIVEAATEVFAERGYHGASVDEIARRSGISVPVLYDHFKSKQLLHRYLLERHFADLRAIWHEHFAADDPMQQRVAGIIDTWFGYVESHPYAWRMLFQDTTGNDEAEDIRRQLSAESHALILPLFAQVRGDETDLEMAWEVVRAAIQGLALWWYDHREVPRKKIVATAMNALWFGLERVRQDEGWTT